MLKRVSNKTLSAAVAAVLYAGTSYAQQPPAETKSTELETVVVTGSLIKGTPVDTALPVEVFNAEELKQRGDPSALEFVKSLSSSGPTTGEAYYFGGSGNSSNVGFNLRGIGADKTLTLFNGKRAFENTAVYPNSVIERVEVLKDGAAVTYGADATGGVVNLITRDNFRGFEVGGSYKTYKGSDQGEWKLHGIAGFGGDSANVLFAVEWDHRSELHSYEREFARQPYAVNPAPWSTLTNVASWTPRGTLPNTPTNSAAGEFGAATKNNVPPFTSTNPFDNYISDFTQGSCEAVGGVYVPRTVIQTRIPPVIGPLTPFTAAPPSCAYGYISYYNLVEENDIYRLFGQVKANITDNSEFYLRALYARNYLPHQYGSPSQPVIRGPSITTGATNQLYVPSVNPYVADFVSRAGFSGAQLAATRGYTAFTYRPFAHGGNETFAQGDNHSTPNEDDTHYWHISMGFSGEWGQAVNYDIGVTYNQFVYVSSAPDVIGFRLQEALNGYGGPNCNTTGLDQDPGRLGTQAVAPGGVDSGARPAGCMWWNPFASNFAAQPVFGLNNPSFNSAYQNPRELAEWLFDKREQETDNYSAVLDAVLSGETPLHLWGKNGIAWGAGAQWRVEKNRETVPDPLYNGMTPCEWPGVDPDPNTTAANFSGCTPDSPGPFLFFGTNVPDATQQRRYSYFAQLDIPVWAWDGAFAKSLDITGAGRHEEFSGNLKSTVWKVSTKFQAIDFDNVHIAIRGALGTNYQAPGPAVIPGDIANGVNSYTIAGGNWRGATTVTRSDIVPETARVWSLGLINQFNWGTDQDLQILIDYFHIQTIDELGLLASANDIANAVFHILPSGSTSLPTNGSALADCSSPLVGRVTFNGGACVQGVTTANDFSNITTDFGNGPGQLTSGLDISVAYQVGVGPGRLRLAAEVTKLQEFSFSPTILDGFVVKPADNRLGTLNFATIANAAPEWRGNFDVNYSIGDHNVRARLNYISGVDDERYVNPDGSINVSALRPAGYQPGTQTPFDPSYFGVIGEDWKSVDIHYLWTVSDTLTVGASVLNVTDRDPPASRQELGYDPRIGSPLGRQFEVSLNAKF